MVRTSLRARHHGNMLMRFVRRHWRAIAVWGMGAFFLLCGIFFLWASTLQLPDLSALEDRKVEQSLKIYDRTGTVLLYDLNGNVQRTIVPLGQISPNIQHATVAIEDPNFYTHHGVEVKAIARAIVIDIEVILHLSGGNTQGGSTITQQVIKGAVLTNDKTISRKLKEWILALKLDRTLTKDQILELYLNQAPYGGSMYGVEQASETFFNKHAADLDIAEAAYLAAVLPAPTYYSPYGNHKAALDARKNLVIDKMFEHGYITADQQTQAKAEQVAFQPQRTTSIQAPHFVFYVRQYLEDKYGPDALDQGGWSVTTSLDADLQAKAEEIVKENALSNTKKFNASNAGMIALDPTNGQILVMVGSRNYFDQDIDGNFNVTLSPRQPGSAFKPFAYAEAFTKGYTPDTVLFDVPTQFSTACSPNDVTNDNPPCYSPVNYDNKFRGPMSLRDAIAQSINIPAVKLLYLAGISDTLQLAKSMGISTLGDPNQYGLTLVLGGGEVTLLDMTSAYGTFATDGTHFQPTAILTIRDSSGKVIEDDTQPTGSQVLESQAAQEINDVLSDPVARAPLGENDIVYFPGYDVAVKTGTTNDYKDAWTIGYTPNLVVGVWAGNNDNTSMTHQVSGFIVGPMWGQFMRYVLPKRPVEYFTRANIDESSLKPALKGQWLVPGSDNVIHELLYWVDKSNPTGPAPTNPSSDPQYAYWEAGLQQWVAKNGFGSSTPSYPQVQQQQQPVQNMPTTPTQPQTVQINSI